MTHSSASHIQGWLLSGFVLSVYVKCFLMSLFCCVWFLFVTKSIFLDYEDLLLSNAMDIENLLNQVSPEMWIRQIQFPPQLATNSLKYLWQLQQQNVSHELHTKWITEWGKLQATSIKPFFFHYHCRQPMLHNECIYVLYSSIPTPTSYAFVSRALIQSLVKCPRNRYLVPGLNQWDFPPLRDEKIACC